MLRRDEDRKCPRMKAVFGNFQGNAARKKCDKSHELSRMTRILGNGTERVHGRSETVEMRRSDERNDGTTLRAKS